MEYIFWGLVALVVIVLVVGVLAWSSSEDDDWIDE